MFGRLFIIEIFIIFLRFIEYYRIEGRMLELDKEVKCCGILFFEYDKLLNY